MAAGASALAASLRIACVTLDELDRWLHTYGRAWERKDSAAFVGCFADEALYAKPVDGAPRGRDEIRARFDQAVSRQENIRFGHELLAVTPDARGLARWWVWIDDPGDCPGRKDAGIFLVTLGGDGLCTEFRNSRFRRATA